MSLICNNTLNLTICILENLMSLHVLVVGGSWTKKMKKPIEIQGLKWGLKSRTLLMDNRNCS